MSCCFADLRRPRSEPSNYYSSEGQRDLPLAKKHKPNPDVLQTRPDKAMSVPLSLEQQQLHKLSTSPKTVSSEGPSSDKCLPMGSSTGTARWTSRETFSSNSLGRKAVGGSGSGSLGKEKLVSRLRQRDQLGMLVMADREMADAELLSYREDLENQDCLTQMDDLQVKLLSPKNTQSLFVWRRFSKMGGCVDNISLAHKNSVPPLFCQPSALGRRHAGHPGILSMTITE